MIAAALCPIPIFAAQGCGQRHEEKRPATPPIKKELQTRLTEDEVIKIAEAAAKADGRKLEKYDRIACRMTEVYTFQSQLDRLLRVEATHAGRRTFSGLGRRRDEESEVMPGE